MKKKKITREEWEYIGIYNPAAKWLRPYCSYTLEKIDSGGFRRQCKIGWIMYLLMFIPIHLLQALCCMWDGGLREFEIESRHLGYDDLYPVGLNNKAYPKAKEIWEKR